MKWKQFTVRHRENRMKSDSEIIRWMLICTIIGLAVILFNRITGNPFVPLEYVILITTWGISLSNRVVATRIKRLFMVLVGLLLFHWYIKEIKYNAFKGEPGFNARIYFWYLYYLPLIAIPVVSYLISDCVSIRSGQKIVRRKRGVYIVSLALFLMVLTNNLHEFVFVFDGPINETRYSYNVGYYMILIWAVLLFLMTLYKLIVKYKYTTKPYQVIFIWIPLLVLLIYVLIYIWGDNKIWLKDVIPLQSIFCICIIWFWESCIQTGLIRSNYKYDRIFEKSSITAEISDEKGKVYYKAGNFDGMTFDRSGEESTGKLTSDGRIIRASRVKGGYVYWIDDVSEIVKIEDDLREVRDHLSEENEILTAEKELKEEELRIVTQNRVYDLISEKVYPQLAKIESLIGFLETNENDRLLAALCILTVYIKRVSNMLLLAESSDTQDIGELELAIRESCEYIKLYGAECETVLNARGRVPNEQLIKMYDEFEQLIEQKIDTLRSVKVELTGEFGEGGDMA